MVSLETWRVSLFCYNHKEEKKTRIMAQRKTTTRATNLGTFADQVLKRQSSAVTAGISSRGIYLRPPDDWTFYLSFEKYHGPLTLNLPTIPSALPDIAPNSTVTLSPTEITFPNQAFQISLKDAQIWDPSTPAKGLPVEIIRTRVASTIDHTLRMANDSGFLCLFKSVLPGNLVSLPGVSGFETPLTQFIFSLNQGNLGAAARVLIALLGLGPGLTPLGDDFILGVVLSLNRWEHVIHPLMELEKLNQSLLKSAKGKTTSLSASLLACAVEGIADERLLVVLDSVFTGKESKLEDLENLLSWGSSSGIAVLAGIMSVLTRLL